jgi:predicted ATP-grasp superfamily ATP-dependent carboligase
MVEVNLVYFKRAKEIKLKNPSLIVFFPPPFSVILTGLYLAEKKNFEIIGYLSSDAYAPIIPVHKNIAMPPVRIMANEEINAIIIISEIAIPLSSINSTVEAITEVIDDYKVSEVCIVSAIEDDESGIYYLSTNKKLKQKFENLQIKELDEGSLTGVSGLLFMKMQESKIPSYVLLINENEEELINIKGSEKAIKTIAKLHGFNIDTKDLAFEQLEILKSEEDIMKQDKKEKGNIYE